MSCIVLCVYFAVIRSDTNKDKIGHRLLLKNSLTVLLILWGNWDFTLYLLLIFTNSNRSIRFYWIDWTWEIYLHMLLILRYSIRRNRRPIEPIHAESSLKGMIRQAFSFSGNTPFELDVIQVWLTWRFPISLNDLPWFNFGFWTLLPSIVWDIKPAYCSL